MSDKRRRLAPPSSVALEAVALLQKRLGQAGARERLKELAARLDAIYAREMARLETQRSENGPKG